MVFIGKKSPRTAFIVRESRSSSSLNYWQKHCIITLSTLSYIVDFRIDSTYFCLIPEPSWSKWQTISCQRVKMKAWRIQWMHSDDVWRQGHLLWLWGVCGMEFDCKDRQCAHLPYFTLRFPWLRRLNTLLARVRRMWMWQLNMWQQKGSSPGHRGEDDGY